MSAATSVVRFYADGWRVALVGEEGRKYLPVIPLDAAGLSVLHIPREEIRSRIRPLVYDFQKALRRFRKAAREFGASEAAKAMLNQEGNS